MDIYNLISFFGIFALIGFAWLVSSDRKKMNWKLIAWGLVFEILIALFVFVVPIGTKMFLFLNTGVMKILDSASAGTRFVFGRLALPPSEESSLGFILAFQGFPAIIFFSSIISILYFFNIMPVIIRGFAYFFTKLMKVSGAESLVTAANVFLGIESNLAVRPHISEMTSSELCTILTAGMATVASNVMALYVFTLKAQFPTIAGHLISASLLSAPAALIMSKIIVPEKSTPKTLGIHVRPYYEKERSFFEAIINGANAGVDMIVRIVALLIAVLGLVSLLDLFLSFFGAKINLLSGIHIDWQLKSLLGYLFYPFALIMGIPVSDAGIITRIIAERVIVTEVVSYQDLATVLAGNLLQNPRSAVIAAYALCGFSHLASMAIFVGGISALAPNRTHDISRVALRALVAATLACFLTACLAGVFFTKNSILFGG